MGRRKPHPFCDSSSEEPTRPEHMPQLGNRDANTGAPSRRRLPTVADRVRFYEGMNKPTLAPRDANPIPSSDSSSEEPTRPEHMPQLVNRDANTGGPSRRRLPTVADRVRFYEGMNKPTLAPRDANPIPSSDSSSEEP